MSTEEGRVARPAEQGQKGLLWALGLILVFFSCTCTAEEGRFPVRVLDGIGREVVVPHPPRRIVSTVPSNTEILYELGLKDRVIAVTSHCGLTCDISGKEVLPGWATLDAESIMSLRPDLVLTFGGLQIPLVDQLQRQGITTFCFAPRTVAETFHQLRLVGRITGAPERADHLVGSAEKQLKSLQEKLLKGQPRKRVTFLRLISPKEGIVAGRYSFQHDILVQAGGTGVMEDFLVDYGKVAFSRIAALDPQAIVLNGDDEEATKRSFAEMDGWKDLRATLQGRVRVMPCRLICHPNFRIVDVVDILSRFLCPEKRN